MKFSNSSFGKLLHAAVFVSAFSACACYDISVKPGVRPEAVTRFNDTSFLFSDVQTGDVYLHNLDTNDSTKFIHAPPGRTGLSLSYDAAHSVVLVAGGSLFPDIPSVMYVYSSKTRKPIVTCAVPPGTWSDDARSLVNGVTIFKNYALFTDSRRPVLYKLWLNSLPVCKVSLVRLYPRRDFLGSVAARIEGVCANGIVPFMDGFIISNSKTKTLYFIKLASPHHRKGRGSGSEVIRLLPYNTLEYADGMSLVRKKGAAHVGLLYLTEPRAKKVSVWRVFKSTLYKRVVARKVGEIRDERFADPSSVAVLRKMLILPNVNFSVPLTRPVQASFTISVMTNRFNLSRDE